MSCEPSILMIADQIKRLSTDLSNNELDVLERIFDNSIEANEFVSHFLSTINEERNGKVDDNNVESILYACEVSEVFLDVLTRKYVTEYFFGTNSREEKVYKKLDRVINIYLFEQNINISDLLKSIINFISQAEIQ